MVNITGLIMRHRTSRGQNKRYSISICQLPNLTAGPVTKIFNDNMIKQSWVRRMWKALKGPSVQENFCRKSRPLAQFSTLISIVTSHFWKNKTYPPKSTHHSQTFVPYFSLLLKYHQEPSAKPSDNLRVPSAQSTEDKKQGTQSWRILSPAEHWAPWQQPHLNVFSVPPPWVNTFISWEHLSVCVVTQQSQTSFQWPEEILTWGSLLLSAGADFVHHDL